VQRDDLGEVENYISAITNSLPRQTVDKSVDRFEV